MTDDPGKAAPASDKDIQSGSVAAADHDAVSAASLLAASSRQAVRGLRAHNENEHDDAALHLGLMIELLAKAYLASLNPALIAEGNDLENLVRVVGHGGLLVGKPKPMGPVGVTVALQRVGQLNVKDPQLHELAGLLRPVGEARNGMAHLGRAGGDPGELAQLAVTGASLLLPLISQSVEGFFRDYAMAAKALLDARATRVQRRLALRQSRARENFEALFGELTPEGRRDALALIDVYASVDDEHQPIECPVCHQTGLLTGNSFIDYDVETENDDGSYHAYVVGATVLLLLIGSPVPTAGSS